jgi:hypothetical protein
MRAKRVGAAVLLSPQWSMRRLRGHLGRARPRHDHELLARRRPVPAGVGNAPGEGIVIHDTGMLRFDEGIRTVLHGIHDTFEEGEDAFCDALS